MILAILHAASKLALLAASMTNILLVQRAERADSLGMAGGLVNLNALGQKCVVNLSDL